MNVTVVGQTLAHVHVGGLFATGAPLITLPVGSFSRFVTAIAPSSLADLITGDTYINIHTAAYPAGEFSLCVCVYDMFGISVLHVCVCFILVVMSVWEMFVSMSCVNCALVCLCTGELRGQVVFGGLGYLSGAGEVPAVSSPYMGAVLAVPSANNTLAVTLALSQPIATETAATLTSAGMAVSFSPILCHVYIVWCDCVCVCR